jgi:Tol biopolymer transport system component
MTRRVWATAAATALLATGAASAARPAPVLRLAYVSPANTYLHQKAALWTADAGGTDRLRLLHGFSGMGAPVWSRDGRRIAVLVCRSGTNWCGQPEVEVVDAATGAATTIARREYQLLGWAAGDRSILVARSHGIYGETYAMLGLGGRLRVIPRAASNASLSPDGRKVLFQTEPGSPFVGNVGVYDIAANRMRLLTRDGYDQWPVWSPDGRQVAFVTDDGIDVPAVIDADGTYRRQFRPADDYDDTIDDLTWISNTKLGLVRMRNSTSPGPARVYVVSAVNGRETKVATGVQSIDWSPSGTELAFSADAAPNRAPRSIFVTPASAPGTRRRVTRNEWSDDPVWSPDGRAIAVDSNVDPDAHRVNIVLLAGKTSRIVDLGRGSFPAWQPLGR